MCATLGRTNTDTGTPSNCPRWARHCCKSGRTSTRPSTHSNARAATWTHSRYVVAHASVRLTPCRLRHRNCARTLRVRHLSSIPCTNTPLKMNCTSWRVNCCRLRMQCRCCKPRPIKSNNSSPNYNERALSPPMHRRHNYRTSSRTLNSRRWSAVQPLT
jgi:hypothetical protein